MRDPIEKLRECADKMERHAREKSEHGFSPLSFKLKRIADEIEAAYIALPVDAEGVPIRPGELLLHGNSGDKRLVESIVLHKDGRAVARTETGGVLMCSDCRHVKPDHVESLLAGFQGETLSAQCEYAGEVIEADCFYRELRALIEDYAERIRKAVEHD